MAGTRESYLPGSHAEGHRSSKNCGLLTGFNDAPVALQDLSWRIHTVPSLQHEEVNYVITRLAVLLVNTMSCKECQRENSFLLAWLPLATWQVQDASQ